MAYRFDAARGDRVVEFFRRFLRHGTARWSGKPFELLPWQADGIIRPLFGWIDEETGLRRYRTAYISTPKKNGKTTLVAGLCLYFLLADGEASPQVFSAAASRDQASMIFREAAAMVRMSPGMIDTVQVIESTKRMLAPGGGIYRALSADAGTNEGHNASAILFDELHAQPDRALWDCLRYSGAARAQPMLISITTAGADMETICGEQYQYARRVLRGEVDDPTFFAFIAEADASDDWASEETWRKANPSYGVTIDPAMFRADFLEARETPAKENSFRRYRLNQWVDISSSWIAMSQWDKCREDFSWESMRGQECFVGIDLSATDDTTAMVFLFGDSGVYRVLAKFYLPARNIEYLERKHKVPYMAWSRMKMLTLTDGNVVDYEAIRKDLVKLAEDYDIRSVVIDRKFQGQQLEGELIDDGFSVFAAGYGWKSQDVALKEIERCVRARRLLHDGHPVLRWHASNAVVEVDKNENFSLSKRKSRSKIDGIAALCNAMQAAMRRDESMGTIEVRSI